MAAPAMAAYRGWLEAASIELGPSWEAAMTAALGARIVAWWDAFAKVLDEGPEWGRPPCGPGL